MCVLFERALLTTIIIRPSASYYLNVEFRENEHATVPSSRWWSSDALARPSRHKVYPYSCVFSMSMKSREMLMPHMCDACVCVCVHKSECVVLARQQFQQFCARCILTTLITFRRGCVHVHITSEENANMARMCESTCATSGDILCYVSCCSFCVHVHVLCIF